MKCDLCGKSSQFGHNVSHSKHRTQKRWLANIHPARIIRDGKTVKVNLCTRCLRTETKLAQTSA